MDGKEDKTEGPEVDLDDAHSIKRRVLAIQLEILEVEKRQADAEANEKEQKEKGEDNEKNVKEGYNMNKIEFRKYFSILSPSLLEKN